MTDSPRGPEVTDAEIDRQLLQHYAGDLERRAVAAGRTLGTEEDEDPAQFGFGPLQFCLGTCYGAVVGSGLTLLPQWALR